MAGKDPNVRHIGEALDRRMTELGLARKDVFPLFRVDQSTLSRWINGRSKVDDPVHQAVAWEFLDADEATRKELLWRQEQWFGRELLSEAEAAARSARRWLRAHPPESASGR